MEEEKKKHPVPPDPGDPARQDVRSRRSQRELPRQRTIADAYADALLNFAYYGSPPARRGTYDSHMDEVQEGRYEF